MAVGTGPFESYASVSTGASPNVEIVAPLSVSTAVRSKTAEAAWIDEGTVAVVGTTDTAVVAATAPGAKTTVARPSVLAAVPPVVGVTTAPAGGPRPLPGTDAGSAGGSTALVGVAVPADDGVLVVVDEPVVEEPDVPPVPEDAGAV